MEHKSFSVVDAIPLLNQLPHHVANAIVVIVLLMVIAYLGTRGLRKNTKRSFVPEAKLTFRTAGEMIVEGLLKIVKDNMGPRGPEFMMIIGALALFIFTSNVLGLIPGFHSPTETLNTTGACAITVFCLTPGPTWPTWAARSSWSPTTIGPRRSASRASSGSNSIACGANRLRNGVRAVE